MFMAGDVFKLGQTKFCLKRDTVPPGIASPTAIRSGTWRNTSFRSSQQCVVNKLASPLILDLVIITELMRRVEALPLSTP